MYMYLYIKIYVHENICMYLFFQRIYIYSKLFPTWKMSRIIVTLSLWPRFDFEGNILGEVFTQRCYEDYSSGLVRNSGTGS